MRTRRDLKNAAKTALSRSYWLLVGVLVVSGIIMSGGINMTYSMGNWTFHGPRSR